MICLPENIFLYILDVKNDPPIYVLQILWHTFNLNFRLTLFKISSQCFRCHVQAVGACVCVCVHLRACQQVNWRPRLDVSRRNAWEEDVTPEPTQCPARLCLASPALTNHPSCPHCFVAIRIFLRILWICCKFRSPMLDFKNQQALLPPPLPPHPLPLSTEAL